MLVCSPIFSTPATNQDHVMKSCALSSSFHPGFSLDGRLSVCGCCTQTQNKFVSLFCDTDKHQTTIFSLLKFVYTRDLFLGISMFMPSCHYFTVKIIIILKYTCSRMLWQNIHCFRYCCGMALILSYGMKTGKPRQTKREKDTTRGIVKSWKYYNHQVRKVYTTFVFHVRALDICRTITSLTVFYPNPLCQLSLWGKPEKTHDFR